MKVFLEKDSSGSWNTVPPVPADKIKNVNCHKFVLWEIGRITWDELISDNKNGDFTFGEKVRGISDVTFKHIESYESLLSFVDQSCAVSKDYIGQIRDAETGEMAHSFILRKESNNEYICFNKPGFKYTFEVGNLESILNFVNKDGEKSNQNQDWRFIPV